MSCKINNKAHKHRCEIYRAEGRRAINKQKKAKRHEKRMERFAKRREEGKNYEYTPNPYEKGSKEYIQEKNRRASKNVNHSTPTAIFDSVMRKLNNKLEVEKNEEKKKLEAKELRKIKKEEENNIE